ncbi:MAG: hypothetical protein AVDCRST_MAG40-2997, partial [uncultured Gemmatimonadaceae bacterium]
ELAGRAAGRAGAPRRHAPRPRGPPRAGALLPLRPLLLRQGRRPGGVGGAGQRLPGAPGRVGQGAGRGLHRAPLPPAVRRLPARFRPERGGAALRDRAPLRHPARERPHRPHLERGRRVQAGAAAVGEPV